MTFNKNRFSISNNTLVTQASNLGFKPSVAPFSFNIPGFGTFEYKGTDYDGGMEDIMGWRKALIIND